MEVKKIRVVGNQGRCTVFVTVYGCENALAEQAPEPIEGDQESKIGFENFMTGVVEMAKLLLGKKEIPIEYEKLDRCDIASLCI